jgi:hypothetical protein
MTSVQFERVALARALSIASKVAGWAAPDWFPPRAEGMKAMPGPPLVEIVAAGGLATIRSANFQREIVVEVPAMGECQAIVPAAMLGGWVHRATGATVHMQLTDAEALFNCGRQRMTLRSSRRPYVPARTPAEVLRAPLSKVRSGFSATVAVPKEGGDQVAMGGVHIRGTAEALGFFSTEHGRAHEQIAPAAGGVALIVPIEAVKLFLVTFDAMEGEVSIHADGRSVAFAAGDIRITSALIDASPLNAEQQFRTERSNVLRATADTLLAHIELATTVSDPRHREFQLRLGAACEVHAASQGGKDDATVALVANWLGSPMRVTFALRPVRDALLLFGKEQIEWRMAGPLEPTVISSVAQPDLRALVAPFLPTTDQKQAKAA